MEDESIRQIWPPRWLNPPAQTTVAGRPIVNFSLAINYGLSGTSVWGYHFFNIAVHAINMLLVFGIVRRTLVSKQLSARFGPHATILAAGVAAVWGLHPLNSMCVTYIVQRAESLMAFCLLTSLFCVVRGSDSSRPAAWYIGAVAACALGMGCKEVMVVAPVVILMYDWIFLSHSWRELLSARKWLYLRLFASWIILAILVAPGPRSASAGLGLGHITPFEYLRTQLLVVFYYLRLAVWPDRLCLDYEWPISGSMLQIAIPGLLLLAVIAIVATGVIRRRPWSFVGTWFFLILAPTSTVVPIIIIASEHRMYLPLVAVVALLVLFSYSLAGRVTSIPRSRNVVIVLCGMAAVALGGRTYARNQDYQSAVRIWRDVVQQRPRNPRGHNNLAQALFEAGRISEAEASAREAIRLSPTYADAHFNLGVILAKRSDYHGSIAAFREAIRVGLPDPLADYNLGVALREVGDTAGAIQQFRKVVKAKPEFYKAAGALGLALAVSGRSEEAVPYLRVAVAHQSEVFELNGLAWMLATSPLDSIRDGREAVMLAERANELARGRSGGCLDTLAAAYAENGSFEEACRTAEAALAIARTNKDEKLAAEIGGRLELYRNRRPYRDTAATTAPAS